MWGGIGVKPLTLEVEKMQEEISVRITEELE